MVRQKKHPSLVGLEELTPQPQAESAGANPFAANLAIQQAGDLRDFGTPNYLGGPGGVVAHGIQTVLDAAGAQDGGLKLAGTLGTSNSPMSGLQRAQPQVHMPNVQMGAPDKEMELRVRRARMLNQQNPAANFTPNVGGFDPYRQ